MTDNDAYVAVPLDWLLRVVEKGVEHPCTANCAVGMCYKCNYTGTSTTGHCPRCYVAPPLHDVNCGHVTPKRPVDDAVYTNYTGEQIDTGVVDIGPEPSDTSIDRIEAQLGQEYRNALKIYQLNYIDRPDMRTDLRVRVESARDELEFYLRSRREVGAL